MRNSAWLRSYPTTPPAMLIMTAVSHEDVDKVFAGCRPAGDNGNSEGIKNEESKDHPDIFVCGPPRQQRAMSHDAERKRGGRGAPFGYGPGGCPTK